MSSHMPDLTARPLVVMLSKRKRLRAPPQGETGAIINELISIMTQVFKRSLNKPRPNDSISRNGALRQPKPYSLEQNLKVWLSQI